MYRRYAIYYTPPPGALARFGAAWLGWDSAAGARSPQPDWADLAGLDLPAVTETPRRYGFHATIKPPFALAPGTDAAGLQADFAALAGRLPAVTLEGLALTRLGRFLALTPTGDQAPVRTLAAEVVRNLDRFRAAPDAAEIARRDRPHLSEAQRGNLLRWGYPHVMDNFRFHMTLTGRTDKATCARLEEVLRPRLAPLLDRPVALDSLSLMGEDAAGFFHQIARVPLTG